MNLEIKPNVNIDLDLTEENLSHLKEWSERLNMSIDQLIEKILENSVAEEIEVKDFQKLPDEEWFKHHWILCEDGVPKVRVIPI
jgi:hypothetical protein